MNNLHPEEKRKWSTSHENSTHIHHSQRTWNFRIPRIVLTLWKVRTWNFWYTRYMDEWYQYFNSLIIVYWWRRREIIGTLAFWGCSMIGELNQVASLHIHSEPLQRGQLGVERGERNRCFSFKSFYSSCSVSSMQFPTQDVWVLGVQSLTFCLGGCVGKDPHNWSAYEKGLAVVNRYYSCKERGVREPHSYPLQKSLLALGPFVVWNSLSLYMSFFLLETN